MKLPQEVLNELNTLYSGMIAYIDKDNKTIGISNGKKVIEVLYTNEDSKFVDRLGIGDSISTTCANESLKVKRSPPTITAKPS